MSGDGPAWAWVDGELLPAGERHLSAFDRGFQLGDGIFETLRARAGRPTESAEHVARLRSSAAGLGIPLPEDLDARLAEAIRGLLAAEGLDGPEGDASVRITVSRGVAAERGLQPSADAVATIVVQAWAVKPFPADRIARGLSLVVSTVRRDARSPLSAFKTISRADTVYAKLEATRAGADDALFLTTDGHLSEATTANLFLVRGGELATPSLDSAILAGTTRSWALRWGAEAGLDVREDLLPLETLLQADEAFLTSSVAGILPVTSLIDADGAARPIGNGRPGRRTLEARSARERFICE